MSLRTWLDKRVVITAVASCALTTLVLLGSPDFSFSPSTASTSREFLRRRLGDVPLTANFKFDGKTADLAQHFYRRHQAGAMVDAIQLTHDELPDRIRSRLDEEQFRFDALPPLLQRALIWDSGFGFDPGLDVNLVPIYTVDGMPMSDIAVPQDVFRRTGCTTSNCSDPTGMAAYRSKNCTGDQMLPVVRCASGPVTITKPHTSMWSTGGDDTAIPVMTIQRHAWKDPVNSTDYVVLAIHMIAQENEPAWDNCPSAGHYSSLIIPCDVYEETRALQTNWTEPRFGDVVTPWLQELKAAEMRHKVLMFAVVPVCVLLFVAAVTMIVVYCLRKHRQSSSTPLCPGIRRWCGRRCGYATGSPHQKQPFSSLQRTLLTPPPPPSHCLPPSLVDTHTSKPLRPRRSSSSATTADESMATTDRMVHVLRNDLHLYDKRLPLDKIHFQTLLSKGGFGEVWLCELDGHRVAVKRLLQNHRAIVEDVEAFTDEIQIMAALHHPNIPRFLGVAWTTLNTLCMATEYLDGGDLQSFLQRRGHQLSWPHEKQTIVLGIARALQYLHSRAPVLIHRDIKSRNILVREAPLIAKVTDFGVTRSVQRDNCMTLGVGTPYWTAPEVLDGTSYTEKSDIYSFGVVLSEIDTGETPYHHVQHLPTSGEGLQPFHILKMVMAGTIQPRFSASCPVALRELAAKCFTFNPAMRPTAREVVRELETMSWEG